jgi:hypothetical protein
MAPGLNKFASSACAWADWFPLEASTMKKMAPLMPSKQNIPNLNSL